MTKRRQHGSSYGCNGMELTVVVEIKSASMETIVWMMDEQNAVLESVLLSPDDLPEQIELPEGTAYLLLQETVSDLNGQRCERSILTSEDGDITLWIPEEQGIYHREEISVLW